MADCALCEAARSRKYGDHSGGDSKRATTCVPGYVVPVRSGLGQSPWHYEDELCWIGECEFCAVPMVVAHQHVSEVSDADRERMLAKLAEVVSQHYGYEPWFDPANLRIPDHFHVHARPVGRLFAHGMHRAPVASR